MARWEGRLLSSTLVALALLCLSMTLGHASPSNASVSTNTWAVLVSTSRYWFNYRHTANALSIYRIVKAAGVPDSNIILMLPDDYACQPRNGAHPAAMFNSAQHSFNLYSDDDIEVDYRGAAVTVESLLRLLTGRHSPHVAKRQRLLSDERSNVLLYVSGHGGNEFLKFQDAEELSATDLALAVRAMHAQRRFSRLLVLSDTCQAESLHAHFDAPGVLSIAASRVGENSYSSSVDPAVGLSLIDRFTDSMLDFFERRQSHHQSKQRSTAGSGGGGADNNTRGSSSAQQHWMTKVSLGDLMSSLDPNRLMSHPVARTDLFPTTLARTPLNAFFAADHQPHVSNSLVDTYPHSHERHTSGTELNPASPPTPVLLAPHVSLPTVCTTSLLRQLHSTTVTPPPRHSPIDAWCATCALVCALVPIMSWLIEQGHQRGKSYVVHRTRADIG